MTADSALGPWLKQLDNIEGAELPLVGGKTYRLAVLKRHGFNVPSGVALTVHFFETHLRQAKLVPLWAGSPDVAVTAEALNWLADSLKTIPLSKTLLDALHSALDEAFSPTPALFAVRSSIIDEDQRDHTFAGLHSTELGVPQSALPIAISRCWASALHGPAIQYRLQHGMSIQAIKIALLIQPMLAPDCAGVGFTVNPITGERNQLVIEAIRGLGEALVSGQVQPYFYRLAKEPPDYPLLEKRVGHASDDGDDILPSSARVQLAYQLEQIEALMGEPQDVEWAWQDNTLFLLQTRPVAAIPEPQQQVDCLWSRGNYPDSLPELPSPLFGSFLERSQAYIQTMFQDMGLRTRGLGAYEKLILGRPYLNLTFLKRAAAQVGLNLDAFLKTMGYSQSNTSGGNFSIDKQTAWQARQVYQSTFNLLRQATRHLESMESLVDDVSHSLVSAGPNVDPDTVLSHLRKQEELYSGLATLLIKLDVGVALLSAVGSRLIAPLSSVPAATIGLLAARGLRSGKEALFAALNELAQTAAQTPPLKNYLLTTPNFGDLAQNPAVPATFKRSFDDLLRQYHIWGTYETDPGWARYQEDPATLLFHIRRSLEQGRPTTETEFSWENLLPATGGGTWRRWLTKPVVARLHRLLAIRYQARDLRARLMAMCRAWHLSLGQAWVGQGWIAQPEDIFWLTLDEIERTVMIGQELAVTLSSTVEGRKATYQTYARTPMPLTLMESQLPAIQLGMEQAEVLSDVIVGMPISPGQARGTVVVLHTPQDFQTVPGTSDTNHILVMPSTGPDWLPLLHQAAGLIVETGGLLSHGSVIAREYGLPAVANIPQATQQFNTGDRVLVDGSTGVVQLLEVAKKS